MKAEIAVMTAENIDKDAIRRGGEILKNGGLVAFPTETVYGLGGNGLDPQASQKIYAAKDRPEIKEQIDAWIDDICTGLVTLCCIFNPSRIILGGGIMAQEYVLSEVNRKVTAKIAPGLRIVEIVTAKLANTAGMMGSVSLAEKLLAQ